MEDTTTREMLVNAIYEYSADEFEKKSDLLQLARESEQQLVMRIINLLSWYNDRINEL